MMWQFEERGGVFNVASHGGPGIEYASGHRIRIYKDPDPSH